MLRKAADPGKLQDILLGLHFIYFLLVYDFKLPYTYTLMYDSKWFHKSFVW